MMRHNTGHSTLHACSTYVQSYRINVLDRVFIHDDILGEIAGEMKVKMNNLCDDVFAIKKHLPSNTWKNEVEEL